MSTESLNTALWGDPSVWFHRSANPQITTNCTISEMRIGCTSYDDADFTDYPATKYCRDICLFGYWRDGYLTPDGNTPLDNTLSYTAIANPELPQCDVRVATTGTTAEWGNQALLQSNPNDVIPLSLATYRDYGQTYNPSYRSQIYGIDGLNNNPTLYHTVGFNRWCPSAQYDTGADIGNVNFGRYNPNGRLGMLGEFGFKSLILEIMVVYYTAGGMYPTEISTLKSYRNQNAAWKEEHPILSAYCKPYWRTNKNGTYTSSLPIGYIADTQMVGISPVMYRTLYSTATSNTYTNYCMGGFGNALEGYFPIYGRCVNDNIYTSDYVATYTYDNPTQTSQRSGAFFYGCQRGKLVKLDGIDYHSASFKLELEGTDENLEWIRQGAAAYGLFFCESIGTLGNSGRDTGDNERWLDNEMFCGVIRENGYTYGEYTRGINNAANSVYGYKKSTETPFDPEIPPQPENHYSTQTHFSSVGKIDTMTKRYVLNAAGVNAMIVDMFGIMDDLSVQSTDWSELINKSIDSFLVQNPIDCIVSLKKYPVKNIPNNGTFTNIYYGRYTKGSVAGYGCEADIYTYAFKPTFIAARFGNSFLDYEPYTSAQIYIPYCGAVSLAMCDIINKTLTTVLCVDYHTGQCTGFILSDGLVIETVQGSIAVDVPVTGIQSATIESQLMQAANASRSVRINQAFGAVEAVGMIGAGAVGGASQAGVGGAAIGGALAFANSAKKAANLHMQKVQADYDLTHQPAPQHVIGASSSACGWIIDSNTARLILYYPTGGVIDDANPPNFIPSKLAEFGSIYGYATLESGTIGSYTGFITATQMQLDSIATPYGIPATDPEIDMIRAALSEGIII